MHLQPRHVLRGVIGAAIVSAFSLSGNANAIAVATTDFYFNGTCADCVLTSGSGGSNLIGTLTLSGGYQQGDAIDETNFVSFAYAGSNIVNPYTVGWGAETYYPGYIAGAIDLAGSSWFKLWFDDGLQFEVATDGSWFTCAPDGVHYYGGTCNLDYNQDFGNGAFAATPGVNDPGQVPEPASLALLGAGLLGIGAMRRRA